MEAGLYQGGGREVSFAAFDGRVEAQVGAPVTRYVRVPWWMHGGLVVPVVAACVLFALLTVMGWMIAAMRRRSEVDMLTRRLTAASRLALMLFVIAIVTAMWLVTAGQALVVLSSAAVIPAALAVYAPAWGGVLLTPCAVWAAVRFWQQGQGSRWARIHQAMVAMATVLLAMFCLGWHIAGTELRF